MTDPFAVASEDLSEYYVSDEPDIVAFDTLEFQHQAFVDGNGNAAAVRFVNAPDDLSATLESDAEMNAAETVTFSKGAFEVTVPESTSPGMPTMNLAVNNVSRILMDYLDLAASNPAPIKMIYRQYLSDDLSEPALIVGGFQVRKATAGLLRVTADATFLDFLNRAFPYRLILKEKYRGLDR